MLTETATRLCVACNKPIKGRSDKKFCDDYCRNNFNNQLKADSNNLVRNINNALAKNRRILEKSINDGEQLGKINKDKLLQRGFLFKYFTHVYTNSKGNTYFYCYDHGYLPLDNEWYLVVKEIYDGSG